MIKKKINIDNKLETIVESDHRKLNNNIFDKN